MREAVTALAFLAVIAIGAATPATAKTYKMSDGRAVSLPDYLGVVGKPALSPDGRRVAYVRVVEPKTDSPADLQPTEIVVASLPTGSPKVLVHPEASDFDLRSVVGLAYSVDGRRLYAEAACPCSSDSVHEINAVNGAHRRIAWGIEMAVLRDGPWRGDLLIGVHTCYREHPGCDYPVHLVSPTGKTLYVVRGTSGDGRAEHLRRWLAKRGWRAW